MYFPASERIARSHATAIGTIEGLDRLIYETGDHPLRPSATADLLGVQPAFLLRLLNQYVQEGILRADERLYCPTCDILLNDDDDQLWCDICERTLTHTEPLRETVFTPVDPILRVDVDPVVAPAHRASVIQFIAGDRGGTHHSQVQAPREFKDIHDAISSSTYRDHFSLAAPIHAATAQEIAAAYRESPTILHFVGHGNDRSLSVLRDRGALVQSQPLTAQQLQEILENFPQRVNICVLNTCDSVAIATALTTAAAVHIAIGWQGQVPDATAVEFSRALYGHLGEGLCFLQAFNLARACTETELATVQLFHADGVDPRNYFAVQM